LESMVLRMSAPIGGQPPTNKKVNAMTKFVYSVVTMKFLAGLYNALRVLEIDLHSF
jgi:hypothetical protein